MASVLTITGINRELIRLLRHRIKDRLRFDQELRFEIMPKSEDFMRPLDDFSTTILAPAIDAAFNDIQERGEIPLSVNYSGQHAVDSWDGIQCRTLSMFRRGTDQQIWIIQARRVAEEMAA